MPYYGKNNYNYAPQMSRIYQYYKNTGEINPYILVLNNYTESKNKNTNTNTKLNATIQAELKKINGELAGIKQNIALNDSHLDETVNIVKDNLIVSNAKITNVSSSCSKINGNLLITEKNNEAIKIINIENFNEIKKQLNGLDKKIDLLISKI
jgi:hypothetical protein